MKLIDALKLAFKVATGRHRLPALNHVRLSKGLLEATDLGVWLRLKVDYQGPTAILPVATLRDILRKAKVLSVTALPQGGFSLHNGLTTATVEGLAPEDYPVLGVDLAAFQPFPGCFGAARMKRAHARLEDLVSEDPTRLVLQYYSLEVHPEGMVDGVITQGGARLVATNGHALSTATVRAVGHFGGEPERCLIQPQCLGLALAAQPDGFLSVARLSSGSERWVALRNEHAELIHRIEDQDYPNWRVVKPSGQGIVGFAVSSTELGEVLEAAPRKQPVIQLIPNGVDCEVAWADEGSSGKTTLRATLKAHKPVALACEQHPRLELAVAPKYLKPLLARSPKPLSIILGAQARLAKVAAGYATQVYVVVDGDQQDGELTLLMPYRQADQDKLYAKPEDIAAAGDFMLARGHALGVFLSEEPALEAEVEEAA